MVYTWNDLVLKEGGTNQAFASVSRRKYVKVAHGIYVDDGVFISELEQLFARYPRATLTMQSAFDYYELSDYVPDKYYITTPYNSHTIGNKKVVQSYMEENMMSIGREKIETKYGFIYIFDKERMLIELFRLRRKLPSSYFLESVSSYRVLKSMDAISFSKVSEYSKRIRNGDKLLKAIQEMI